MNKKDTELFITEISEEDFRKLDVKAYAWVAYSSPSWQECSMNNVLDSIIKSAMEFADEESLELLKTPVIIAIHKENGPNPSDYYLDKYTTFLGPATYVQGVNIEHLYSTRDYFENKADCWRVRKDETKAIYRIHLDSKWLDQFVLKHKVVRIPWPYPVDGYEDGEIKRELWIYYDRNDNNSEIWEEKAYKQVIYFANSKQIIPVDEKGHELVKYKDEP